MDDQSNKNIVEIDVNELQANPLQPRGVITADSITDLVESIKEHDILEPLVVAHTPAGFQIIVGERRWRASKMAGKKTVPCIVKETSPQGMLEMALVENVQREDLNPLDRAKAFQRLMEEFHFSNSEIAKKISKSPAYISNTIKLLTLPDALKDGLLSGLITEGHARALQGIQDSRLMIEAYKMVLKESASVRRAEEIARRMRMASGQPPAAASKLRGMAEMNKFIMDEKIDKIEDEMRSVFTGRAKVTIRRSKRQTKLYLFLLGSPEETEADLEKLYQAIVGIKPSLATGQ